MIHRHSLSREGKSREKREKEQARTLFISRISSGRRQNVIFTEKTNTVAVGNTTFHPVTL